MTARCETCGHGAHIAPCLNMASDNDCVCRGIMDDPDTIAMRDAIDSMWGTDPQHWLIACAATKQSRATAGISQVAALRGLAQAFDDAAHDLKTASSLVAGLVLAKSIANKTAGAIADGTILDGPSPDSHEWLGMNR